jgi:hypothetical protein
MITAIEIFPSGEIITAAPWFNESGGECFALIGFRNPVAAMRKIIDSLISLENLTAEVIDDEYVRDMRIAWPSSDEKRKRVFSKISERYKSKTTIPFK